MAKKITIKKKVKAKPKKASTFDTNPNDPPPAPPGGGGKP